MRQKILGRRCFLSISYSSDTAWAAFAFDAEIGVDAVEVEAFKQMADVERIYLGNKSGEEICGTEDKCLQFAKRWSAMEARFKRAGLPMREHTTPPDAHVRHLLHEGTVVAVAFR